MKFKVGCEGYRSCLASWRSTNQIRHSMGHRLHRLEPEFNRSVKTENYIIRYRSQKARLLYVRHVFILMRVPAEARSVQCQEY